MRGPCCPDKSPCTPVTLHRTDTLSGRSPVVVGRSLHDRPQGLPQGLRATGRPLSLGGFRPGPLALTGSRSLERGGGTSCHRQMCPNGWPPARSSRADLLPGPMLSLGTADGLGQTVLGWWHCPGTVGHLAVSLASALQMPGVLPHPRGVTAKSATDIAERPLEGRAPSCRGPPPQGTPPDPRNLPRPPVSSLPRPGTPISQD
ncbi:hypothetical protein HJG60_010448 [Phyllostomus discolor]|uniref:Uncharacterized protein n=1 Tax=Phyllostomus discolor TaxID=89673 RepID=A0A834ANR8_9CHIR|nr:hypothetical protein HJG60_010448 [Phyllostomus discolor]